jgi:hypothetical protein
MHHVNNFLTCKVMFIKKKYLTSYQTVTIMLSNQKVTYSIIRQTQRRSAYFPDVDFKCCFFSEFDGGIKNGLYKMW